MNIVIVHDCALSLKSIGSSRGMHIIIEFISAHHSLR